MALALYRKYRPRTFAEVIGQEHVTEPLTQALRSGRLHHAYLFSGPRGCGKTSSARIMARSLNCEHGPTPEPCGRCVSCLSLANDGAGSIDVIEIDAASHGGVDDARDLREKAFFAPANSRFKIYVIDEAHMVSSAGFNALLKLVEEPPEYVKFIFATTEPEKVLGTIRSRTHHYPFRLIPPATLRPYLEQLCEAEGALVDPAVYPLVVRAGGGSARDTLSVLDQLIAGAGADGVGYARAVALLGVTDAALIDEMCDALAAGDGAAAYATVDRVAQAGHDPRRFASDLLERLRDLIVVQHVPDAFAKGLIDGPVDQLERMSGQAGRLGPATLSRCADIVHNGLVEMRGTTAPRLLLELVTARMLLPGAEDSTGALLQRLERMERRLALSDTGSQAPPGPARLDRAPPASATPGGSHTANLAEPAPSALPRPVPEVPAREADARDPAPAAPTGRAAERGRDAPERQPSPRPLEASAVMPDPPLQVNAPAAEADGVSQLSAAAVRDIWPQIVTMVGQRSKKIAALAQGAAVRDLDGQTVVLKFRFPAHARMVATQPELLADALYEVLGGRWEIRCEVAGEGSGAPTGSDDVTLPRNTTTPSSTTTPSNTTPTAATLRSEPVSQAPAVSAGEEWPEPARPGGIAASGVTAPPALPPVNMGLARTTATAGAASSARDGNARTVVADGGAFDEASSVARGQADDRAAGRADGQAHPGSSSTFEGFDPGDEPLDDVVDQATVRQGSEHQAMQLLRDTFGAEKIGDA